MARRKASGAAPEEGHRLIITAVGHDRVGIIAGIANVLAEANANILDISQTILQGFFTMVMVVDVAHCTLPLDQLRERLVSKGAELGLVVNIQHEDVFKFMHRI
ncbi:MAG: ACT domain-containing protein [Syntrophomonadaceae bacterium]|nr:ACT domain-containing protein [Syntrophomonadaceae bacterium]